MSSAKSSSTCSSSTSSAAGAVATVTVLARYPVQCADGGSLQSVESPVPLGPLDYPVLPFVPIAVVFVYRQPTTTSGLRASCSAHQLIPIERLLRALARLLDFYPHLTGRITFNPEDQKPEIDRLGMGAELLSAQCDAPLDAFYDTSTLDDTPPRLLVTNLPAGGNALLAPFDSSMEGICRNPILTVQHTRFACGSVSLGVRLLHLVCDADGYFQFVRDLAQLYQAFGPTTSTAEEQLPHQLRHLPHVRSYLMDLSSAMSPEERKAALEFKPSVFELIPPDTTRPPTTDDTDTSASDSSSSPAEEASFLEAEPAATSPPPVIGRVLRFSAGELAAIKAEANNNSSTSDSELSTFDALSAHLWQSVSRARLQFLCESRGISASDAVQHLPCDFLMSINWRGPSRLDLPPRYFPNCVFCSFFSLPADDLLNASLGTVAAAVHAAVRSLSREEATQTLRWIAAQPNKRRVKLGFRFEKCGFLVSQWCKFDMYRGCAFDTLPTLVSPPFTPISLIDGLTYFVDTQESAAEPGDPPSTHHGQSRATTTSIDVNMALSEPLWAILDQDTCFRRHAPTKYFTKKRGNNHL